MTCQGNDYRDRRRRGAAMLLVLIAVAMCTILALSFLAAQEPTAVVASNIDRKTQARAIAESALKMAIDYVNEDADWRSDKSSGVWMSDIALDGGVFTLTGTDEDDGDLTDDNSDAVRLTVVASYAGVTHRVSALVTPGSGASGQSPGLFMKWWDLSSEPSELDDIDWDQTPTTTTIEEDIDWGSTSGTWMSGFPADDFAVELTGYLTVPTSGSWTLYLDSDDGSALVFDGAELIDNDGLHGMEEHSGSVTLTAGQAYPIRVRFFERSGGAGLEMNWSGPSQGKQRIPASAFTHDDPSAAPEEDDNEVPTLLALYEFNQVEVAPTLAGRWPLDEVGAGATGAVQMGDKLTLNNGSYIDAYDSSSGAYGGANQHLDVSFSTNSTSSRDVLINSGTIYGDVQVGSGGNPSSVVKIYTGSVTGTQTAQSSNIAITDFDTPSGFGGHSGNQTYNGGSHTWSSDQHFNKLTLNNGAQVTVDGNVAVRVSNMLALNNGDIILNPGATLTLWVGHTVTINNGSTINDDTTRPGDLSIILYGSNKDMTLNGGRIVGAVHVSDDLTINNGSAIYGSVTVNDDLTINVGAIHADLTTSPAGGTTSSPTIAADTSDLGNDGTVFNGPIGGIAGQHGTAFEFDGSNDYIEIPHDDSYLMQGGTFSVWFKADTVSGQRGLFSKDSSGFDTGGHFSVWILNGKIEVRMQSTTASNFVRSASNSIVAGTWYHIMFAWGEEGMALYLDGVLVDTNSYTGGIGTTSGGVGNYEPIVLGANAWQTGNFNSSGLNGFFDGVLDDLRIYNERLSESQAVEIFNGATEPSPFLSKAIVEDTSDYGDPLTLSLTQTDEVSWGTNALTFTGNAHATSLSPATKLHDAIESSGEFSVELLLTRASPGSTSSPSRIVSYADGASSHNFMLGQDGASYEARVRDSDTGNNGTLAPEFISSTDLNSGGDTHVILSYNEGEVSVYLDGVLDETNTAGGVLNNWDDDHYLVFGGAYGGSNFWRGTLKRVAIYDKSFNAIQADNVYNGDDPGSGESGVSGSGSVQWDELD